MGIDVCILKSIKLKGLIVKSDIRIIQNELCRRNTTYYLLPYYYGKKVLGKDTHTLYEVAALVQKYEIYRIADFSEIFHARLIPVTFSNLQFVAKMIKSQFLDESVGN